MTDKRKKTRATKQCTVFYLSQSGPVCQSPSSCEYGVNIGQMTAINPCRRKKKRLIPSTKYSCSYMSN